MSSVPSSADTRRFDRASWLTLAFVLGVAVVCILVSALILRLPSDGCVTSDYSTGATTPQIVDTCYGDWPTPLQHGDKVLTFGSFTISNDIDSAIPSWGGTAPPPGWGVGATIPYTIQRGDATLTLDVPISQLSWIAVGRVLLYVFGPSNNNLSGWIQEVLLQLSAVIIFALAPRSNGARLLLLAFGTQFAFTRLGWGGGAVSSAAAFAQGPLHAANYLANGFWIWGFWPSLILLVLSFPRRVWLITRWPRLVPAALYIAPLLVVLVSPFLATPLFYIIVLLGQFALLFVAFIAVTTHTFLRVPDRVVRAQTGWLLLALGSYLIPLILLYPFILFDSSVQNTWPTIFSLLLNLVSLLFGIATPIFFGIAITRYRLFDIDVVIRRTLVYTVLTLALGAVYLVAVVTLQALFVRLTGQESALAVVASTLAIAALFGPLRRQVQALIDRRFFRRKYDARRVLEQFTQRIQQADIDEVAKDIVHVVQETLEPDQVQIWIAHRS